MFTLAGIDGNAFNILGHVSQALRKSGLKSDIEKYMAEATSGDYNHLLAVSQKYIDRANEALGEAGEW